MKNCKQLTDEIFEKIEQKKRRQERAKKRVKQGFLACLAVFLVPLSVAFAAGHVSVEPLFQPIEKEWEQSSDDTSLLPSENKAVFDNL